MANNSKMLTIKQNYESTNSIFVNSTEFFREKELINTLKSLLEKKGILITNFSISRNNNTIFLSLEIFYFTSKVLKYKKILKKKLSKYKKNSIKELLNKVIESESINLKVKVVNWKVKPNHIKTLYNKFKFFQNRLFARRFNLFLDFLKLTALFSERTINVKIYISILSRIFKFLQKKAHNRFFFFLKQLFEHLTKKETKIKGIQFKISGKLKGKLRSSNLKILVGKIESSSIQTIADYGSSDSFTIYGCFGLKMYVNYK